MSADRDEPFLSRWARQKRAAKATPSEPAGSVETEAAAPEEPVDLAKLPRIEDLTAESDISGFLRKGVPEAVQRLALRRMWALDPAIRDFVEVAENQWDFNAAGGIHGLYQTIDEGADVGVWLAQATQSVLSPAPDDGIVAVQRGEVSQVANCDPVAETASPLGQAAIPMSSDATAQEAPGRDSSPLRRRHGTALPE